MKALTAEEWFLKSPHHKPERVCNDKKSGNYGFELVSIIDVDLFDLLDRYHQYRAEAVIEGLTDEEIHDKYSTMVGPVSFVDAKRNFNKRIGMKEAREELLKRLNQNK